MKTLEQIIQSIEKDNRFATCCQTIGGMYETSIFYSPLNRGVIDRKEIQKTISRNVSYTIAYYETFEYFKKWLVANDIAHNIQFN